MVRFGFVFFSFAKRCVRIVHETPNQLMSTCLNNNSRQHHFHSKRNILLFIFSVLTIDQTNEWTFECVRLVWTPSVKFSYVESSQTGAAKTKQDKIVMKMPSRINSSRLELCPTSVSTSRLSRFDVCIARRISIAPFWRSWVSIYLMYSQQFICKMSEIILRIWWHHSVMQTNLYNAPLRTRPEAL